jgi:uncharacterized membrane protein YoaK (UPF0700 family)
MREPDVPSPLSHSRRAILASIVLATLVTIGASIHDGSVASRWTNALGFLLGGLAGTFIGEHLERFGERIAATGIAWLQMAVIAFLFVGIVSWQSLPAYCQLPVSFAMGAVIVAAMVYIQRVRLRLP